jgi:hypothetical protein
MFAQKSLALHAEFFQNALGSHIALEMVGEHAVEFQDAEGKTDERSGRFGGVSLVPVGLADPVSQFCVVVLTVNVV